MTAAECSYCGKGTQTEERTIETMHGTNEVAVTLAEAESSVNPASASASSATPDSTNVDSAVAPPTTTMVTHTTTAAQDAADGGSALRATALRLVFRATLRGDLLIYGQFVQLVVQHSSR